MILELSDGKQIVLTADSRTEGIWLQLQANRGSLGVELTKDEAIELSKRLWYEAKKG